MPRWCLITLFCIVPAMALAQKLPQHPPEEAGFDGAKLAAIDAEIAAAIEQKKMPGCVVCIGRRGNIALLKAYGQRSV
jgi:CubicO group peptidase (beta-lactamase class C family)